MPTKAENRQLFISWLRNSNPAHYVAAMQNIVTGGQYPVTAKSAFAQLAGYGVGAYMGDVSDGSDSTGSDALSFSADPLAYVPPDVSAPPASDFTVIAPPSSSGDSTFASFLKAVSSTANAVIQTDAQSQLLSINAQRAAKGFPPLNQYGQPVTAGMLTGANSTVSNAERLLAGNTSSATLPLLLGGGLLLFVLAKRRA
jgi:hypothetical protein